MKIAAFLILMCFPFIGFAQNIYIIEAPVGLLRDEPKVTATIIYKIEENEKIKLIEKINQNWSKITYQRDNEWITGYITNQTLGGVTDTKEELIATTTKKSGN